jgi:transposase
VGDDLVDLVLGGQMETVVERPAGLDVHKAQVTACVRVPSADGRGREQHVAEFSTTVAGLLTLLDWLVSHRVTHVAMEATGVYWLPVVRHEALFGRVG